MTKELFVDFKKFHTLGFFSLIILLAFLNFACSVENNDIHESRDLLISKIWLRESFYDSTTETFEFYEVKSEFQFFSNGNLLIKQPPSNDTSNSGLITPPPGVSDTLLIDGKWVYFQESNTLTININHSFPQADTYECANCELSEIDNNHLEIVNRNTNLNSHIFKIRFKSRI